LCICLKRAEEERLWNGYQKQPQKDEKKKQPGTIPKTGGLWSKIRATVTGVATQFADDEAGNGGGEKGSKSGAPDIEGGLASDGEYAADFSQMTAEAQGTDKLTITLTLTLTPTLT